MPEKVISDEHRFDTMDLLVSSAHALGRNDVEEARSLAESALQNINTMINLIIINNK